jgi:hypothetical protein
MTQEYQLNLSEEEGFETMGPLIITNGSSNNNRIIAIERAYSFVVHIIIIIIISDNMQ